MGKQGYEYDSSSFSFKKAKLTTVKAIKRFILLILVSIVFSIVVYSLFSLVFSTELERKYSEEIRAYEQTYDDLIEKEKMLGAVISGLQAKDNKIYQELFHSNIPAVNPMTSLTEQYGSDTIADKKILKYTYDKTEYLLEKKDGVEDNFKKIYKLLARQKGKGYPPMSFPLKNISYTQIGATNGMKLSPFLKTIVYHDGLDILAPQGSEVFATAPGIVTDVRRSSKNSGNIIEISHGNGYTTRYEHLSSMLVSKGQRVSRGTKIGAVGVTGAVFAPHLHYRVTKEGLVLDPLSYMFADVDAEGYTGMLFMAATMKQSMD